MQRKIKFAPGEFYHLYNRGTDKRIIFKSKKDHARFMVLLYLCNTNDQVRLGEEFRKGLTLNDMFDVKRENTLIDIGAYVLMPNHFHILVHEKEENGISSFMKKLCTAYSMYFNTKYDRSGGLFEGRFKATHADYDNYLKYLFSYIHLNPVKHIDSEWKENGIRNRKKAKNFLNTYQYSSYLDYKGVKRNERQIINREPFPDYFSDRNSFDNYIDDWLGYDIEQFTQGPTSRARSVLV
ncbi:transposase [Patescibacteria group bacterium]|nr:transposase [Patescibacteria group bacterium]